MYSLPSLLAFASLAKAHYNFPTMTTGSTTTTVWDAVRNWNNSVSYIPVQDVSSVDIRCNVDPETAPSILSVAAGSTLGFNSAPAIYHPGPALAYMAKVPTGQTAVSWDGSGAVWFKVFETGPIFGDGTLDWDTTNMATVPIPIPASTPSGQYLVRVEQIALHNANTVGGAQFYLSCGQVTVTGGGSGTPGPLVAFPGAYSSSDPGILIAIYWPIPTNYAFPGPAVWSG